MIVTSKEMVQRARQEGYAVPAINVQGGNYDIIRAICDAAEEMNSPIILAYYVATGQYCGMDWSAQVAQWVGSRVSVPVAIHLDHGDSFERCAQALHCGFTSIMLDRSSESVEENARQIGEVQRLCNALEIPLEAEIGELVRLDDPSSARGSNAVNPADIKRFLELCQPDMLAIGIGNAHGFYGSKPDIKLSILEETQKFTDIPLVLHGCTGMDDDTIKKAIALGVAKINFGTAIRYRYMELLKEGMDTLSHNGHIWQVSQYAKNHLQDTITDIIKLSGAQGKAH